MSRVWSALFLGIVLAVSASVLRAEPGVTAQRILLGIEGETRSFSNEAENLGFKVAFREINDAGGIAGRRIDWLGYTRAGSDVEAGMANARRLVETDGVFALINMGGPLAIPLATYAEAARVPYLFPHTALIDSRGRRYVFTSFPRYADEAKVMFRYLPKERGLTRLAIVHDENVYGRFFLDQLGHYASANGYEVVGNVPVRTRDPVDLSDELRTLTDAKPDGIVMALYPAQAKVAMQAKAKLGWNGRMISVGPLTDEQFLNLPGGEAEGTLGFCYYPDPDRSPAAGVAAYRAAMAHYEPGRPLNRYTLYGYTFGRLVAEGLRRASPGLDRESFVAALETIRQWDSGAVMPPVDLSRDNHHAQFAGFLCELKDRRFEPLSDWIGP